MSVPAAYIGVILIWATTPLAIQWSSEGWGFLFAVAARMTLGALLCLLVLHALRSKLPWHRRAVMTYAAAGMGIYGAMLCVYWGAQFIASGLIAVMFALNPIVTAFLAALWLSERSLTPGKILGAAAGFGGVFIIFRADIGQHALAWQGLAAVLVSVFLHSASSVWVKRIGEDLSGLQIATGALLMVVPLYLATWLLFGEGVVAKGTLRAASATAYLGVFGSVLGFSLYFYVLKHLQANKVALITLVTPVLALLIGYSVNGETVGVAVWQGALSIMLGLALHQWADDIVKRVRFSLG